MAEQKMNRKENLTGKLIERSAWLALGLGLVCCSRSDRVPADDRSVQDTEEDAQDDEETTHSDAGSSVASGSAKPDAGTSRKVDASAGATSGPAPDAGTELGSSADDASRPAAADGDGGASAAPSADLGKGDGKDVIELGDSWMAGIAPQLNMVSGQPYRNYSAGGVPILMETAGAGGRSTIPKQYAKAKMADPDIKTVVMTAGGIDLNEGPGRGAEGNAKIAKALMDLWTEMAADGVKDIVYYTYSRASGEAAIMALAETQMKACSAPPAGLRCHFIDADTIIDRMLADGIHPTREGSKKIAEATLKLMEEKGMRR
jgi:lysophospholipase L1-like esterase